MLSGDIISRRSISTPSPGTAATAQHCRDVLSQVLQQTVISRLRLAHPELGPPSLRAPRRAGSVPEFVPDHIDSFADALCWDSQAMVDRGIESLIARSDGVEGLLLDFLPSVEARLTELAAEDGGAAYLMLAQLRLRELVERLGLRLHGVAGKPRHERRALLATTEPDAFRLRLQIAAETMVHHGWDVWDEPDRELPALIEIARGGWFALIMIGTEHTPVETLAAAIRGLRRSSPNPHLRILVLSAALVGRPDRLMRVGADAVAGTLRQAAVQSGRLLALMPPQI